MKTISMDNRKIIPFSVLIYFEDINHVLITHLLVTWFSAAEFDIAN